MKQKGDEILCGIYKITNKVNNKVYIGQSIDIYKRWKEHKSCNSDKPLYKAFKKYGLKNFNFEVVEICSQNKLNDKEIYYINQFNSFIGRGRKEDAWGYNLTIGGEGGKTVIAPVENILSDYNKGLPIGEISQKYNICSDIVHRTLIENNIAIRNGTEQRMQKRKYNASVIWSLVEKCFCVEEIMKILKLRKVKVIRVLKESKTSNSKTENLIKCGFIDDEIQEILCV